MYRLYSLIILLCISSLATAQDLKLLVKQKNMKYMEHFNAGDAENLSKLYTEDALYSMDGFPLVKGREAIIEQLKLEMSAGPASIVLKTVDLQRDNKTATETGTWVVTIKEENTDIKINGNYLVVWEQQDNKDWLISRDLINLSEKH